MCVRISVSIPAWWKLLFLKPKEDVMKRRQFKTAVAIVLMASLLVAGVAAAQVPATPTQQSPANGATDLPTTVTVRWTLSVPGETYRVQVATNAAMTALIVNATVSNATGYTLFEILAKNTTYCWRTQPKREYQPGRPPGASRPPIGDSCYPYARISCGRHRNIPASSGPPWCGTPPQERSRMIL
jgi:hypothetical protein